MEGVAMREKKRLIWQLEGHGYKKEELEKKSKDELILLFRESTKKMILNFLDETKDTVKIDMHIDDKGLDVKERIKEIHKEILGDEVDYPKLYAMIEVFFEDHSFHETSELILSKMHDRYYKRVATMIEVLYREYQEKLLDKLSQLLKNFPKEERLEQMKIYSKRREHLSFLRKRIKELTRDNENLSKISNLKFDIISNFYPEIMDDSYEESHENIEQKNQIVERILKLTKAYKAAQLKEKRIDNLIEIERVLIANNNQEKEEKSLIKGFTKEIEEVLNAEDEYAFVRILKEALSVLGEKDVRRMISQFDIASNPVMLRQFNTIMNDNRSSSKH